MFSPGITPDFLASLAADLPSSRDRDFLQRVYGTPKGVYLERLRRIGFSDHDLVVDAACGFGQWSLALAALNTEIRAIDFSPYRLEVAARVAEKIGQTNVDWVQGNIQELDLPVDSAEAIFCYSALYYTDFRQTLKGFLRVLKPGGKLYVSGHGVGWYIHNILNQPNPSEDFDPREMAVQAIVDTISYFASGEASPGRDLILPGSVLVEELQSAGFVDIRLAGEAQLSVGDSDAEVRPFFDSSYCGREGVFEILCRKAT